MKIEDAKVIKDNNFSVLTCSFNNEEYNLATEFKRMIEQAFNKYPKENYPVIASMLGISSRSLFRVVKEWNIDTGREHNHGYKQLNK